VTEERIQRRIAELRAERDKYLQQANAQLATYNGAIAALEELLQPEPASESAQPLGAPEAEA